MPRLVIFGLSNILSDLFDCALANGLGLEKVVIHHPESLGERDLGIHDRLAALARIATPPQLQELKDFSPAADEIYLLGPTTSTRSELADLLTARFGLAFHVLVHPTAYVSPLATLREGVFVGANSVIAPGAVLDRHVFVNRGATIGHDTHIGAYSRVQPGSHLGSLSILGERVTVGLGASLAERLRVGEGAFIAAGAVVLKDVAPRTLVAGVPAKVVKELNT
jgi:sugar O-acyltransferase (sialic acid O-acetyltransferase NeuD family)